MAQDDHAIVVGLTTYPGFTSLIGAENDAKAFEQWLLDPAKGAVPQGQIKRLLSSDTHPPAPNAAADAHPWEDELNQLFKAHVQAAAKNQRVGRRLYIYAAGHGFSDPADMSSAALYAANAEDFFSPHLTATAYASFFRRAAVFDEVVLIMDCCRTNSLMQSTRVPPLPNIAPRAAAQNVATFTAFGASFGSPSREKQFPAGEARGIFTVALLEAFDKCLPDAQGNVTGSAVKNYIHNNITSIADPVKIAPPEIPIADRDVTLLVRAVATVSVTFTVPAGAVGQQLVIQQSGVERARINIQTASFVHALPAGLYKASVDAINLKVLFEVLGDDITVAL